MCICTLTFEVLKMPRQVKCRRVCFKPQNLYFNCENKSDECVTLTFEEIEAMRLCDFEGLEQDVAASSMNISRGTLQRILYKARHNLTDALVNGKNININGGNYDIKFGGCKGKNKCKCCKIDNFKGDTKNE